jgi:hypothetical protein
LSTQRRSATPTTALRRWRKVGIDGAYWPVDGVGEQLMLFLDEDGLELRVSVWLDVEQDQDPALEASLPGLVRPVLARWDAAMMIDADPIKARWLRVQLTLPGRGRRVAALQERRGRPAKQRPHDDHDRKMSLFPGSQRPARGRPGRRRGAISRRSGRKLVIPDPDY